ncbi:MAG TPA: gliding motility protein GldL [Bacteroidales bacterium]|nr:gliding motility protein GldL [Bacteroidales bacterium]HPS16012.1 gliding motility protein GldL [Bacteroidales bacterium]
MKNLVRSKKFKNFMSKLYGWGASVVIIGALFKIEHYPGAGPMLMIGLGTEAIIFFFSAFEPPHVEPDWSLVYPELAGMYHDAEAEAEESEHKKSMTEELDKMLEEAKIGPELIASLGKGLTKLNETTSKLSDVSEASAASDEFVQNIKSASKSAGELTNSYNKTSEALTKDISSTEGYANSIKAVSQSANELANTYAQTSEVLKSDLGASQDYVNSVKKATSSALELADQYSKSAESLTKSAQAIDFSAVDGKSYGEQIQKISQNLAALNSVYELQLKGTSEQVQATNKLQDTLNQFMSNLGESNDNTLKFKSEIATLTKNLSALNNVYGNMLAAMNVNVNR